MVKKIQRKLTQLSNMLYISLPQQDFVRKFTLSKGDSIEMFVLNDALLIIPEGLCFTFEDIINDIKQVKKLENQKLERQQKIWFDKLSPDEQEECKKNWEQMAAELSGKVPLKNVIHLDSPYWIIPPRNPEDPNFKDWVSLHPELAKKYAEALLESLKKSSEKEVKSNEKSHNT